MTSYLRKIDDYVNRLGQETQAALARISMTRTLKKGDYLLQQDEVCKKSFLIEKGIARKFYLNDGREITTELLFENDLAVSFSSYCLQKPGTEFIQCLTETTVTETDFIAFETAKQQFPELAALDLMITEYYAMWLEDRLFQLRTLNAGQRYLKLIKDHPHIIKNVPLTHIASYLSISLETLSRIRARI